MKKEIWKSVVGYERIYEISDFGRLRSLDRLSSDGRKLKGRLLNPHQNKLGYRRAPLGGRGKNRQQIHRLVVSAFIGKIPEGMVIDHLDGDPSNNHVSNLEIVTYHENMVRGKLCKQAESKYVGVVRNKSNWSARKFVNGEQFFFGTYRTEEEAYEAYLLVRPTVKRIKKPLKGYSFNKRNGKFMVEVMNKYYGYFKTESEAIEKVAEVRKGLQSTMTEQ